LTGALGLDVVWQVVGVVAAGLVRVAAGDGVAVTGPELLDAGVVVGVDNGGDIIPDDISIGEVDLAKHAGDVGGSSVDGVEVADPALASSPGGLAVRSKSDRGASDRLHVLITGEVDGLGDSVKVLEGDGVGSDSGGSNNDCGEGLGEKHIVDLVG